MFEYPLLRGFYILLDDREVVLVHTVHFSFRALQTVSTELCQWPSRHSTMIGGTRDSAVHDVDSSSTHQGNKTLSGQHAREGYRWIARWLSQR